MRTQNNDIIQCNRVPIMDALCKAPQNPFFSENSNCLNLGTVLR